ncbi:uncharacterized protein ACOB7L_001963 isoform 1-T3 [Callospermophilus lateralis]|uniref:uncharacterized protein LOC143383762 isoform X1 n=2 Tax=Callospermophilus lateralis TaxID=76772 RepID=UPI004053E74E
MPREIADTLIQSPVRHSPADPGQRPRGQGGQGGLSFQRGQRTAQRKARASDLRDGPAARGVGSCEGEGLVPTGAVLTEQREVAGTRFLLEKSLARHARCLQPLSPWASTNAQTEASRKLSRACGVGSALPCSLGQDESAAGSQVGLRVLSLPGLGTPQLRPMAETTLSTSAWRWLQVVGLLVLVQEDEPRVTKPRPQPCLFLTVGQGLSKLLRLAVRLPPPASASPVSGTRVVAAVSSSHGVMLATVTTLPDSREGNKTHDGREERRHPGSHHREGTAPTDAASASRTRPPPVQQQPRPPLQESPGPGQAGHGAPAWSKARASLTWAGPLEPRAELT